ncbi:MAG: ATP-binding cassette domain-containing protein [Pseudomonadota bacterium]
MPSSTRSDFQIAMRVFRLLRGEWKDIAVIFIYALGVGLCSLAIPVGVQSLVNSVAFGVVLQPLVVITSLVGGVLLFSGMLRILQLYVVEILQRRLVVRLSLMLAQRIPHMEFELFRGKFGPEYVLRFMEVFSAQKIVATLLLDGMAVFFQVVVGLVLVSFYHPFFLAFAVILTILLIVLVLPLGVGGIKTAVRASDAKYEVMTWLQDLARLPVLFKSNHGDGFALERADSLIGDYLRWRSKHFRVLLRQIVTSIGLQVFASTLLLGLGGWLVIKQQLTLGQLVAAELIVSVILTGVAKLGLYIEKFYDLCASVAKIDALFDIPYEKLSGSFFEPGKDPAGLRISNLTVQHELAATPLFTRLELNVAPGEKVAIWGENGSGKSILANCIYRLEDHKTGRVEIDGHDVREIHPLELRSEVALVREVAVFHGTIEENLTLSAKESVSYARIREALAMVGLLEEIYALPEGLKTILKGQWGPLSRGQVERLMIARALLMEPRLMIIDGTLDGIDEKAIQPLIERLTSQRCACSLVVLTHDRTVWSLFPRKFEIQAGSLKESRA